MTNDIMIIMGSDFSASLRWCQFDRSGSDHSAVNSGSLNDFTVFAQSFDSADYHLVLEGYDAISKSIDLPAKTEVQARAAAPFILEDEIATPADETHFALGENNNSKRQITYIAKTIIEDVLDTLTEAGIELAGIYADHGLLTDNDDTMQIIQMPDGDVVIAQNKGMGLRVEAAYVSTLIPALIKELDAPIRYYGDQLNLSNAEQIATLSSNDIVARYMRGISANHAINLLQGAYAPAKAWGELWLVWRRATFLVALIAIAWTSSFLYETWKLSDEIDRLDRLTQSAIQEAFPNARSVAQVQARLTELRRSDTNQFIQLSSILFASLQENEGTTILTLRYNEERSEIAVSLSARSFADIESIKNAIAQRGGALSEGGSRQDGSNILADVIIRRAL